MKIVAKALAIGALTALTACGGSEAGDNAQAAAENQAEALENQAGAQEEQADNATGNTAESL